MHADCVVIFEGYGHVTPKTSGGRFATILYAIVGIPLMFLYLSTIGNYLATVFRMFYFRVFCRCVQRCRNLSDTMATTLRTSTDLPLTSSRQPSTHPRKPVRNQMVNVATASCRRVSTSRQTTELASSGFCLPLASVRLDSQSDSGNLPTIDRSTRQSMSASRVPLFDFSSCHCTSSSPIENRPYELQQNHSLTSRRVLWSTCCGGKRGVGLLNGPATSSALSVATGNSTGQQVQQCATGRDAIDYAIMSPRQASTTVILEPEVEIDLRLDDAESTAPLRDAVLFKSDRSHGPEAGARTATTLQDIGVDSSITSIDSTDDVSKISELIGVGIVRLVDSVATPSPANYLQVDGFETNKRATSSGSIRGLIMKTCNAKLRGKLRLGSRTFFTTTTRTKTSTAVDGRSSSPVTTAALEVTTPCRIDETEILSDPIENGTSPSSGPTCDALVHCEISEGEKGGVGDVTSAYDGACQTAIWRCKYAASQLGTALRRKITAEPRRKKSTLRSTKIDDITPSASWNTSNIGRVQKVGTKAIRWATLVKGRVTRVTSFKTTTADRYSTSAAVNDSAVDDSTTADAKMRNCSDIFVRFRGFNKSAERRNVVVDDVTAAAASSSSVVVHLTNPSVSSDSFVTALDSLEWLPRLDMDHDSIDVMSVDLACNEKEHRELIIGCVASDSHSLLCKPEDDGQLSFDKEAFVGGVSVNPVADYLLDRCGSAVTAATEAFRIDEHDIQVNVVERRTAERYRRQLHRGPPGCHRNVVVDKQRVPIYVCLIVIAVHICLSHRDCRTYLFGNIAVHSVGGMGLVDVPLFLFHHADDDRLRRRRSRHIGR